jgi:lipopolysaccharide export system permease protein
MPGRFHAINSGQQVFYVQSMSRDHTKAEQVFLAKKSNKNDKVQWDILWADKAYAETDLKTQEEYIVLHDGKEYQGVPGNADYQVAEFADYKARLPHPTILGLNDDLRTASFSSLWPLNNPDPEKAAELQWRLSIPLMVLTLTFIAVPLSRVNSRTGKFAKLLPAILIYILYANFMFVARNATAAGKIPIWIGMGWIHILVIIIGLLLIWRNQVKLA